MEAYMEPAPVDMDTAKRAAATKALEFVEDGMKIGLGSGSTAEIFVDLLSQHLADTPMDLRFVATSGRIREYATGLGLEIDELNNLGFLDLVIDGADEFDANLDLIKGGGGALLHEKIVASATDMMVVIADSSKHVHQLGTYPLPVEIITTGFESTLIGLQIALDKMGYVLPEYDLRKDGMFMTDEGNYIVDFNLQKIHDPVLVQKELNNQTGVVECGLFLDLCDYVICGHYDGSTVTFANLD